MDLGVHPENSITYNIAAELANKENIDMIHEVKEQSSGELAQARAEWEERMQRIHHLESEAEASQVLAREACSERDELRGMLDQKQVEMRVEDQETINEMKKLLAGLTAQDDSSQTSGVELTRQLADLIDKNLERLAQRAEVRPSCLVCLASFTQSLTISSTSNNKTSTSSPSVNGLRTLRRIMRMESGSAESVR